MIFSSHSVLHLEPMGMFSNLTRLMILNSFLVSVTVIVTFFPVNEGLVELVAKYWHFLGYQTYRISESMAKDSDGSTQSVWMVFDIRITFENLVP